MKQIVLNIQTHKYEIWQRNKGTASVPIILASLDSFFQAELFLNLGNIESILKSRIEGEDIVFYQNISKRYMKMVDFLAANPINCYQELSPMVSKFDVYDTKQNKIFSLMKHKDILYSLSYFNDGEEISFDLFKNTIQRLRELSKDFDVSDDDLDNHFKKIIQWIFDNSMDFWVNGIPSDEDIIELSQTIKSFS